VFDPHGRYRLSERVGLRPEPFGALAYHFDTRRLVFLKSRDLVDLVRALADHPSADDAIDAVVAPPAGRRPAYVTALASLHDAGVVEAS
jgi:putative mycofactocin binding protein MftB